MRIFVCIDTLASCTHVLITSWFQTSHNVKAKTTNYTWSITTLRLLFVEFCCCFSPFPPNSLYFLSFFLWIWWMSLLIGSAQGKFPRLNFTLGFALWREELTIHEVDWYPKTSEDVAVGSAAIRLFPCSLYTRWNGSSYFYLVIKTNVRQLVYRKIMPKLKDNCQILRTIFHAEGIIIPYISKPETDLLIF